MGQAARCLVLHLRDEGTPILREGMRHLQLSRKSWKISEQGKDQRAQGRRMKARLKGRLKKTSERRGQAS